MASLVVCVAGSSVRVDVEGWTVVDSVVCVVVGSGVVVEVRLFSLDELLSPPVDDDPPLPPDELPFVPDRGGVVVDSEVGGVVVVVRVDESNDPEFNAESS